MTANAKTDTARPGFDSTGSEMLERWVALGRDAMERTMKMNADATVRACRGVAAAGAAQLEMARALGEKMASSGPENLGALSASSEAAIAGVEACMEKAIDYTRAATDANLEAIGRARTARSLDEWVGTHFDSAARMMDLGLAHAGEVARIASDAAIRCAGPMKTRVESTVKGMEA